MSLFVVTFTPYFKKSVINELLLVDPKIIVKDKFSDSIILIETEMKKNEFINSLIKFDSIFIKHIMPLEKTFNILKKLDLDKTIILNEVQTIVSLNEKEKFAVQCRIVKSNVDYSAKDIEVFIGESFYEKGAIHEFTLEELKNEIINIISILIYEDKCLIGYSNTFENLNIHSDEYRIYSREKTEISRAENKLKEALIKFKIDLKGGTALDIGAAPGGWTKVLVDYGFKVVSVDPRNLNPKLEKHPNVKHFKCRIEDLKFDKCFDIIVNDMNVDPDITSYVMNSLASTLKEEGIAIVTLKLPNHPEKRILEAKKILSEKYEVLSIKSLFHNRREVTAFLKNKKPQ